MTTRASELAGEPPSGATPPGRGQRISVALCTYNGARFLPAQLDSFLAQTRLPDELVVCDDSSSDGTWALLEDFARRAPFPVRLERNPERLGSTKNFEKAIGLCTGDLIATSDQDDVWLPGKVEAVVKAVENGARVVLHDAKVTDAGLQVTAESFFAQRGSRPGFWRNLVKNSFVGCCMAFTASYKDRFLPFPEKLPMHDWWIGLLASLDKGAVVFLREPLLLYRRHPGTVTGRSTGLFQKTAWRARMLYLSASRFAADRKRSNV